MNKADKLERATSFLKEINHDYLTVDQFRSILGSLSDAVVKSKEDFKQQLNQKTVEYLRRYKAIEDSLGEMATEWQADLARKADAKQTRDQIDRLYRQLDTLADDLRSEMPDIPDMTPLQGQLVSLTKAHEATRDELAQNRKEMVKLRDAASPGPRLFATGVRGFQLLVNTVKKNQVNYMNLIAGTGVSIVHAYNAGRNDVTISAGAAGTPVAGEVVSGSGTSFTLANTPISGTLQLFGRGQRITNFTLSGAAITTSDTWSSGDLVADYYH